MLVRHIALDAEGAVVFNGAAACNEECCLHARACLTHGAPAVKILDCFLHA